MSNGAPVTFNPQHPPAGIVEQLSPLVRRLIAPNGSAFTCTGTCTYIVGHGRVAIIDPGPADPRHLDAMLEAVPGETVAHILVTHTHRDHSPAAAFLRERTGAPIFGCAPHWPARQLALGEEGKLDAANDLTYLPDRIMDDNETLEGVGYRLTAVATPGHTMNHICFALAQENSLFSGDHVMAWSTSIVAPPDGSMAAYMTSLDKLRGRAEGVYWPGHGGPVQDPQRFVRGLATHRRQREAAIIGRLMAGDRRIPDIVAAIYEGLDPRLKGAAALSVFAHLEDICARGLARTQGEPMLTSEYAPG